MEAIVNFARTLEEAIPFVSAKSSVNCRDLCHLRSRALGALPSLWRGSNLMQTGFISN